MASSGSVTEFNSCLSEHRGKTYSGLPANLPVKQKMYNCGRPMIIFDPYQRFTFGEGQNNLYLLSLSWFSFASPCYYFSDNLRSHTPVLFLCWIISIILHLSNLCCQTSHNKAPSLWILLYLFRVAASLQFFFLTSLETGAEYNVKTWTWHPTHWFIYVSMRTLINRY